MCRVTQAKMTREVESGSSKPQNQYLCPSPRHLKWGCRVPRWFSSQWNCSNVDRPRNRPKLVFIQVRKFLWLIKLIVILRIDYPNDSIKQLSASNVISKNVSKLLTSETTTLKGPKVIHSDNASRDLRSKTNSMWAGKYLRTHIWFPMRLHFCSVPPSDCWALWCHLSDWCTVTG